jgi:hypothetical protein
MESQVKKLTKTERAFQMVNEEYLKDPFDPKVLRDKYIAFRDRMIGRISREFKCATHESAKGYFSRAFQKATGGRMKQEYKWSERSENPLDGPKGMKRTRWRKSSEEATAVADQFLFGGANWTT